MLDSICTVFVGIEASRDLKVKMVSTETPLCTVDLPKLDSKVVIVPILRAGTHQIIL